MTTLLRHRVVVIFGFALGLSLFAIILLWIYGDDAVPFAAVSLSLNFWSVYRSDRSGFIRSRELRRACEPPRRFNELQSLALIVIALTEFSVGAYVLMG